MAKNVMANDSIFRHIIITTDGKEHPFRNRKVALEFKAQVFA